jgi:hypothetical protein
MDPTKETRILQGMSAYSAILKGDELKVALRRLKLVIIFQLKYRVCTLDWILRGRNIFLLSLWFDAFTIC